MDWILRCVKTYLYTCNVMVLNTVDVLLISAHHFSRFNLSLNVSDRPFRSSVLLCRDTERRTTIIQNQQRIPASIWKVNAQKRNTEAFYQCFFLKCIRFVAISIIYQNLLASTNVNRLPGDVLLVCSII